LSAEIFIGQNRNARFVLTESVALPGIRVCDTPSQLGGGFTVSILETLAENAVKVRVWYGRATAQAGRRGRIGTATRSRPTAPHSAMNKQCRSFERIDSDKNGGARAPPFLLFLRELPIIGTSKGNTAMKQFTFSDMNRVSGEILETALIEPVALTKRGKEKLVILSAAQYHQLVGQPHSVAYTLEDAPDEVHNELMTGLDAIISGDTPHA
jgi:PHD/YefM family antitoxin component YafN of YafNO toxin-antitoxin module